MKSIHKKGKGCRMDNPLDKFKYKCPECSLMVKRIDVKNHMKENHGLGASLKSKSPVGVKCFNCKFHAPNLDAVKLHIKNHHKKNKQKFICKYCDNKFLNTFELSKHIKIIHEQKEKNISLEEFGITQKPEILPRIKQSIRLEDL